ncbi:MAG: MBL fold metallo-hydrolase, partial [Desulfuromonadaceae bacterium]|nr:MBL fold metallo-hydrolase [Desulfuromonadaceae bacterium]
NSGLLGKFCATLMIHQSDAPMLKRAADVGRMYGVKSENSPDVDVCLEDGMIFTFGRQSLKVLHTPGHTQGGCCLYFEKEGIVITGDTLFAESIGRTDLPGGSHEQILESIRSKLFTLPENVRVYPGHGEETTIGHEKRSNPYF